LIALYVVACLHGNVHGKPQDVCRELPIRAHETVMECTAAAPGEATDWLKGMLAVGIDAEVSVWRCAQRKPAGDDD
jgi:hypothetical protein